MGTVLSDFGEGYQLKPAPGALIIKAAELDGPPLRAHRHGKISSVGNSLTADSKKPPPPKKKIG